MADIQGGFPHNEEQHKVSKEEKRKKKLRKKKKQHRRDMEKIRLLKKQKKCAHKLCKEKERRCRAEGEVAAYKEILKKIHLGFTKPSELDEHIIEVEGEVHDA